MENKESVVGCGHGKIRTLLHRLSENRPNCLDRCVVKSGVVSPAAPTPRNFVVSTRVKVNPPHGTVYGLSSLWWILRGVPSLNLLVTQHLLGCKIFALLL